MDPLGALKSDAWGALFVASSVLLLFGGAELASRALRLPVEYTRKLTHVGGGAIVLGFPWFIQHDVTVGVLALAFAGVLIGGRLTGWLGSIHNVERTTGGAYYYPFAVWLAWWLSGGEPLLYCVPLAIMAVADTGAAIVGQRRGETTFQVMDGRRSVEGSLAFFALAFAVVLLGGMLANTPGWPDILLVALVVAALTTSVEAISVRGSDNLLIPYAAWLALERTQRLGLPELGDWVLGMGLGVGVLRASASRARLSVAAAVNVFLVATLAFALGGLVWFLPLGLLWSLWLLARPGTTDTELDAVFPTTAGAVVLVLCQAHFPEVDLFAAFLATVVAHGAMAAAALAGFRGWPRLPAVALTAALVCAPAAASGAAVPWAALAGVAALAPVAHQLSLRQPWPGRRVGVALASALAVWAWAPSPG